LDTLDGSFILILKTRNILRSEVGKLLGNCPLGRQEINGKIKKFGKVCGEDGRQTKLALDHAQWQALV
jgi:hypothetical protein